MKIYCANDSKQTMGGGWTFIRNLKKALKNGVDFVDNIDDCDIFFISGATMVTRDTVKRAKELRKKIVLRVDNAPKNSRNRNTGTSRLKDFAEMADYIVYQSSWAKDYLDSWLMSKNAEVILNGVDTDIFKKGKSSIKKEGNPQYLYVRSSRDETKRWHEAWYQYQLIQQKEKDAHLWIVGPFSPEQIKYNFDFFRDEKYRYWGVIDSKERMADIYRATDVLLCPFYNDACSNVILEAMACGTKISLNMTGGNLDIASYYERHEKVPDLKYMRNKYLKVFKWLCQAR